MSILAGISSTLLPSSLFDENIVPDNPSSKEDRKLMTDPADNELLDIYYKALSRVKILSRQEETEALKEYRDTNTSKDRKQRLKAAVLESNLRLVFSMAKGMWDKKDPDLLADLIANGNVGLLLALDKFNPDYGTRFCTYAGHWVLMTMRKSYRGLVRTPSNKPPAQIAGDEELPVGTYEDTVADDLDDIQRRAVLSMWIRFLSNRERYIVSRSYSLKNPEEKPSSLRDMSRELGLSSERVRQIRAGALEKLKLWMSYHFPEVED
jgi:RNA polymerase sigma factor (sigma-70 family)